MHDCADEYEAADWFCEDNPTIDYRTARDIVEEHGTTLELFESETGHTGGFVDYNTRQLLDWLGY